MTLLNLKLRPGKNIIIIKHPTIFWFVFNILGQFGANRRNNFKLKESGETDLKMFLREVLKFDSGCTMNGKGSVAMIISMTIFSW